MVTRAMAAEFKSRNICVVALSPGWVRTAMGGPNAPLMPEESAESIARTITKLSMKHTSQFMGRDGNTRDYEW
jgi:NAD(P)-dependent dehydrogenase (short-subunit alcohol dehydrogenase family)